MKRYAFCLAVVSLGIGSVVLPAAAAAAASAKAKQICSDRWAAEKKANTIPRGMTHAKYLKQCTANYAANATSAQAPDQSSSAATAWPATIPH